MGDFIPRTDAELLLWLTSFRTNISAQAATLGLPAAQVTALQTACDNIINAIMAANNLKQKLGEAVSFKEAQKATNLAIIRKEVAAVKTNTNFTNAIGLSLAVINKDGALDTATYKAQISAGTVTGFVRIKFVKNGVDGVNIYHRKKGEAAWKFLARDTKSPYDDHIDLATPGQPEHWEYRAYGVIDDVEIGQPSDIAEVVFGG